MRAEIVAKRDRPPLVLTSGGDDVHVMRVRPLGWPMKEWTSLVVRMRHVDVPERRERPRVRVDRVQPLHRDLNIDHGFGGEARDGGGSVVFDPARKRAQRG